MASHLQWLPELTTWRDKDAKPNLTGISFNKKRFLKTKFFRQNPELSALDSKYSEYRALCRPKRPPGYTRPHPYLHPRRPIWYGAADPCFNDLTKDKVTLRLQAPQQTKSFYWQMDSRVETIFERKSKKNQPELALVADGKTYAVRSVMLCAYNSAIYADIGCEKEYEPIEPAKNPVVCTVDFGLRNLAVIGVYRIEDGKPKLQRTSFIEFKRIERISSLERLLDKKNRETGIISLGHNKRLRTKRKNILEDEGRKVAHEIIEFARSQNASIMCVKI